MIEQILKFFRQLPPYLNNIVLAVAALLTGFIFKVIVNQVLRLYSKKSDNYSLFRSILTRLNRPMSVLLPLLVLNMAMPLMDLTRQQDTVINKIVYIAMVAAIANTLIAVVKIFEDAVTNIYKLNKENNLRERKIRTQLQFVRKVIVSLIIILSVGAVLLSFSSLRRIGTGLLTGVGISGIIVGFAAQRSLGNLLAGLQIAFTQPLRIDDVLVVEGEWGRVEEITLTYVVLSLWDQRRFILPINYFIEKPFQNWTRTSSQILGTVFLYLDYTAPFDELRDEFKRQLEATDLWDKRVASMQVTDTTERTVQIRLLLSASNSSRAFDLRCHIRENMVGFIQKNFPESLPKNRTVVDGVPEPLLAAASKS